jgi:hypothetical protein
MPLIFCDNQAKQGENCIYITALSDVTLICLGDLCHTFRRIDCLHCKSRWMYGRFAESHWVHHLLRSMHCDCGGISFLHHHIWWLYHTSEKPVNSMNMEDEWAIFWDNFGEYFIRIAHQIKFGKYLLQFIAQYFAVPFPLQNNKKLIFVFLSKTCRASLYVFIFERFDGFS